MSWETTPAIGIFVRCAVSITSIYLLVRLLREKITTTRVSSAIAALMALGVLWLADIEGATRLVFMGLEIDRRVESARAILDRLELVERTASETILRLQEIEEEASKTGTNLSSLVERENKKFEISKLEKTAIDGGRKSYERLRDYDSSDDELNERAGLAVLSVKRFYIGTSKTKGRQIHRTGPSGERIEEKDFETSWLIQDLKENSDWVVRTRVAELLKKRKAKGVPEALLNAMETDANLWVCREALRSFESITGHKEIDVFEFETKRPRRWYEEHFEEVAKRLSSPAK